MKTVSLLRAVRCKDGREFPQGERFTIAFDKAPNGAVYMVATRVSNGDVFKTARFQSFFKAPSLATMERWTNDGIARTVTGDRTEPDGYGPDGAPSWLIALGLI